MPAYNNWQDYSFFIFISFKSIAPKIKMTAKTIIEFLKLPVNWSTIPDINVPSEILIIMHIWLKLKYEQVFFVFGIKWFMNLDVKT